MKTEVLKIEGMTCGHCVMSVRRELSKVPGLKVSDVEIGSAHVEYDENAVEREALALAIDEAGYKLANIENDPK